MIQQPLQFELAKDRVIPIAVGKHTYLLTVAPITKAWWLAYFEGIVSTTENVNGKQTDYFDANGAKLTLMNKALSNVEGYRTSTDGVFYEKPEWRELIPAAHRLAACNILVSVSHSETDEDDPIMLGAETVTLDALWGSVDGKTVAKVSGLKHTFSTPTVEQQRRYSRDRSRSQVIGGSRNGKTRWLGAQATLADIYDELIQSVEGYTYQGQTLETKDQIVRDMDTFHKVFAAESLFAPVSAAVEVKEEE